jgi:ferredoxin
MWLDAETAYQVPVGREGLASAGGAFGSGIVLPIGDGTCPLGEVSRIASYLAGESAGQCGPCKLGLPTIARALAAIVDGSGGIEALDVARRAAATINGRGACGHPDGTTRFVLSALEVFTEDLAAHVFHSSCGRPVRGMLPLPDGPEMTDAKQLMVDWVRCEGHGLCALPVPPWLEKEAKHAVQMCPALALRLDTDPRKRGAASAAKTGPIPVAAPIARTGLLGPRKSITSG